LSTLIMSVDNKKRFTKNLIEEFDHGSD
jgi:hypothetical protein